MTAGGSGFHSGGCLLKGCRLLGGCHVGHPADTALDGALGYEAIIVETTDTDRFKQPLLTLNVVCNITARRLTKEVTAKVHQRLRR